MESRAVEGEAELFTQTASRDSGTSREAFIWKVTVTSEVDGHLTSRKRKSPGRIFWGFPELSDSTGEGSQHRDTPGLRETEPDHDPRKRDPPSHANSDEVNRTTADYSNPPCRIKPPKETAGLLLQPELPILKRVFLIRASSPCPESDSSTPGK